MLYAPGFIDTKLTAGFGASKSPEEGTAAIRHCLFAPVVDEGAAAAADGTGAAERLVLWQRTAPTYPTQ